MQSTFEFAGDQWRAPLTPCLTDWPPQTHSLDPDWQVHWREFVASDQGQSLVTRLRQSLDAGACIYPPEPLRIFRMLPAREVRVVILGQDPYHGPGQAEGFAFSVPDGIPAPPSLRNIFKEIQRDMPASLPTSGHLGAWVAQGVFLLNTVLTVQAHEPASHARWGWEAWTDQVIGVLARQDRPLVFVLWGAHAQAKQKLITALDAAARHCILLANHPSPLSALRGPTPFMGCGHFLQANDFLRKTAQTPIQW